MGLEEQDEEKYAGQVKFNEKLPSGIIVVQRTRYFPLDQARYFSKMLAKAHNAFIEKTRGEHSKRIDIEGFDFMDTRKLMGITSSKMPTFKKRVELHGPIGIPVGVEPGMSVNVIMLDRKHIPQNKMPPLRTEHPEKESTAYLKYVRDGKPDWVDYTPDLKNEIDCLSEKKDE